jgi:hypothetical protein
MSTMNIDLRALTYPPPHIQQPPPPREREKDPTKPELSFPRSFIGYHFLTALSMPSL